ncbi:hypothetical protein Dimus_010763, partial [Dionaea muscipula]
ANHKEQQHLTYRDHAAERSLYGSTSSYGDGPPDHEFVDPSKIQLYGMPHFFGIEEVFQTPN